MLIAFSLSSFLEATLISGIRWCLLLAGYSLRTACSILHHLDNASFIRNTSETPLLSFHYKNNFSQVESTPIVPQDNGLENNMVILPESDMRRSLHLRYILHRHSVPHRSECGTRISCLTVVTDRLLMTSD